MMRRAVLTGLINLPTTSVPSNKRGKSRTTATTRFDVHNLIQPDSVTACQPLCALWSGLILVVARYLSLLTWTA